MMLDFDRGQLDYASSRIAEASGGGLTKFRPRQRCHFPARIESRERNDAGRFRFYIRSRSVSIIELLQSNMTDGIVVDTSDKVGRALRLAKEPGRRRQRVGSMIERGAREPVRFGSWDR
jgi:hypothetical protein